MDANIDSDHYPVIGKYTIKMRKAGKTGTPPTKYITPNETEKFELNKTIREIMTFKPVNLENWSKAIQCNDKLIPCQNQLLVEHYNPLLVTQISDCPHLVIKVMLWRQMTGFGSPFSST